MITINTHEKVHTVPETLAVSNVAQEKDSGLSEKSICCEYTSANAVSDSSTDVATTTVTLNVNTPLSRPSVSFSANNVPIWKESTAWRHHRQTTRRTIHTTNKLARANAQWNDHYQHDLQTTTDRTRTISFTHESEAAVLFLETKTECEGNRPDSRLQWKNFMLLVDDLKDNGGMHKYVAQELVNICHDCRDDELDFSFAAIEGHANFYHLAGHLSRYRLAELYNKMDGVQVTLRCPLEKPGGGYEPNSAIVAPAVLKRETTRWQQVDVQSEMEPRKRKHGRLSGEPDESRDGKRRRINEPPRTNRRSKKKLSWRQPPRCWTRNARRSAPPEERSGVAAAIAEFQQLQLVSEESSSACCICWRIGRFRGHTF